MTRANKNPEYSKAWNEYAKARDTFEKLASEHRAALDRVSDAARRQVYDGTADADREYVKAKKAADKTGSALVDARKVAIDAAHAFRKLHHATDNPFPLFAALGALGAIGAKRNPRAVPIYSRPLLLPNGKPLRKTWTKIGEAPTREEAQKQADQFLSDWGSNRAEVRIGGTKKNPSRTENPAPVANPAPIPRLALLGTVEEIVIQSHALRSTLRPRGALLLVSADARTIVIARPSSSAACKMPSGSTAARKMFEKWSQFKSDRAVRLDLSDKPLTVDLGSAQVIRYRSDKWTGKPTLYEHVFSKKTTAIADSYRAPHMIRIDGDPPRVLVTDRGIVG